MRDQPEQQAPPVQRLRVRYAKRGRLRFTSHRDFSRAFERAIVRAGVPMAYSSGFNPHPRISYAGASPTGAASEAEYLEIGLARETEPTAVLAALDEALPPGLDVLEVVVSTGGSLSDLLEASLWRSRLPGVSAERAEEAVGAFLASEQALVERMTKKGLRSFDCRAAVVRLALVREVDQSAPAHEVAAHHDAGHDTAAHQVAAHDAAAHRVAAHDAAAQVADEDAQQVVGRGVSRGPEANAEVGLAECAILEMVLRHGTPTVRPDDVLAGLRTTSGLEAAAAPSHERLAQGPLDTVTGTVGDPLALNRDTA